MIVPSLMRLERMRLRLFRTLSQIGITYRGLAPNQGRVGELAAGDRLPWVANDDGIGNFGSLRSMSWQVHVYGAASEALQSLCKERTLPLHEQPWQAGAAAAGLARDALYLIRPDGHIGFAHPTQDAAALTRYLDSVHIRMRAEPKQNGRRRYG
jgi:hypothetical protein